MEIAALIFSGISAFAAVLSAIAAFKTKKELQQIKQANNNKINQQVENNDGNMIGINNGEINGKTKR